MTREQKERLTAWCLNLLVTYRIDFFRGSAFSDIVGLIMLGDKEEKYIDRAQGIIHGALSLGFEADTKDYTELLRELSQVEKEVPLSDAAYQAITHVFGGYWAEAIEALDRLRSERNEQN